MKHSKKPFNLLLSAMIVIAAVMSSCSSTRHVPEGKLLLNSVKLNIEDAPEVSSMSLINYLRQMPNHKVFGFAKLQLGIYNLSGRDSSKWYNRWIRNIGQPPAIYDQALTDQSINQLKLSLINRGYNDAVVTADTTLSHNGRAIDLTYNIKPGSPLMVENITYTFDDPDIKDVIMADSALITLTPGMSLDRNILERERQAITSRLRDRGYYAFSKDFISFIADTVAGSKGVDLTMQIRRPDITAPSAGGKSESADIHHKKYIVARVTYRLDGDTDLPADTIVNHGFTFVYGHDRYLNPSILEEKCFIRPDAPYSATDVNRTYEALASLPIVKYVNIAMVPVASLGDVNAIEAIITLSRTKKQSATFSLEGTNSEGDLGFGIGMTYQHRNLARGAQLLTAKFRAAYESISGNLEGIINNRYSEYSAEVGITFPKFEAPFLSRSFKQRVLAKTEFAATFNYQERPEYTRIISGLAWKYRWDNRSNTYRRTFDFIDLSYVNLPRSTIDFINTIAPTNPLLRYSYEDHLIMRMGYSFYRTNQLPIATDRLSVAPFQRNIWTLKASIESAGNLLYGISKIVGQHKHGGAYKILDTQYAQYVKGEIDYAFLHRFDHRNSIAFHGGFGIGVPYGNSSMIPFEKRFYAGGANSVRGWGVRTLGPGSYDSRNSVTDFINQCGDIRLDLSVEYRLKLFWVMEGALFIDAGNIWTIRNYENQPGGLFKFGEFYKQIAAAYGAGLRFDFTYFLLRLDLGLKAHNPAMNQEPWPLINPRWKRDATLHFSIGYPF